MTGDGAFETVAGLRATRISFNAESVDVTSLESTGGWRELLAGAGVKTAAISGSGVFKDADSDERARQIFFDGQTPDFQVIIPDSQKLPVAQWGPRGWRRRCWRVPLARVAHDNRV